MCFSGHFSLAIVCFMDKEEGAGEILILHLDSLQYHQSTRIFEIITWILRRKWEEKSTLDFPQIVTKPVEFGKNWFDPLTACALRERIKPIIEAEIEIESKRDELKAGNTLGKKRRRVIGEKKTMPIEPLEHVQKKVTRAKARKIVTRDQTRRHMKLRRNIKTVDGPVMKRKQIKYSEGSADLTPVNQNVRNLRSTIKIVLGHKRKREHVDYAHLSNKPRFSLAPFLFCL
ncbi:hypothetical protein AG4045_015821 [Apium graveolens]|uniref:Uncharacterized protein n=1 Tax=Apium graveolens TaxID=4045 RepID=A0A6L5B753_APIGR|nr:hypothetical protein AG4045_015821 [Apium graveolens]